MSLFKWSKVAANNATADSTCPFPEGMAPSALNDGTRGMMAAVAKYRDDIAGAIVTGGTSTAYTVFSYEGFGSFADLNGQMIAFTPHATNGATVTLNVDALGVKPLRSSPGLELPSGSLILGTPYVATYNNADGAWYLQGGLSNPYNIPLAAGMPYFGFSAPNSSFAFPFGQAISRATYSALFGLISTTYGVGDNATTFNLPDLRGRVPAGGDGMGGVAAGRLTQISGLGAVGGAETHVLTVSEMPSHDHGGLTGVMNVNQVHGHNYPTPSSTTTPAQVVGGASAFFWTGAATGTVNATGIDHQHVIPAQGGGAAHSVTQPTIACNYIIRII